ncbi:MAG: formylglycine-generating enzyme family protein [Polyangiaceae bacterium]|nr:formylglycine-generating enzyme family protein [Polyangiaceae bacterium]
MRKVAVFGLGLLLGTACGPAPSTTTDPPVTPDRPPPPEPPAVSSAVAPEPVATATATAVTAPPVPTVEPAASTGAGCPAGMLRIEGATFRMGSDSGEADEKPVHSVTLAGFCIDAREVTVAEFRRCVDAGKCVAHATAEWRGISEKDQEFRSQSCNWGQDNRDNHPINCVDWRQSNAYCEWAGKRLPTEEEWEYAARGKDGRVYPWGDDPPSAARLNGCGAECAAWAKSKGLTWKPMYDGDDGYATTAPVGSFAAGRSPFGVDDMAGNVAEWTASGYSQDYSRARNNVTRVLRGGSARSETPTLVRSSNRHKNIATDRLGGIGFRCAK